MEGNEESPIDNSYSKVFIAWEDEGHKYRLEMRSNAVGRFLLCWLWMKELSGSALSFLKGKASLELGKPSLSLSNL